MVAGVAVQYRRLRQGVTGRILIVSAAGGGSGVSGEPTANCGKEEGRPMTWTTPTLVEICIGLEINGYLPAEI